MVLMVMALKQIFLQHSGITYNVVVNGLMLTAFTIILSYYIKWFGNNVSLCMEITLEVLCSLCHYSANCEKRSPIFIYKIKWNTNNKIRDLFKVKLYTIRSETKKKEQEREREREKKERERKKKWESEKKKR